MRKASYTSGKLFGEGEAPAEPPRPSGAHQEMRQNAPVAVISLQSIFAYVIPWENGAQRRDGLLLPCRYPVLRGQVEGGPAHNKPGGAWGGLAGAGEKTSHI